MAEARGKKLGLISQLEGALQYSVVFSYNKHTSNAIWAIRVENKRDQPGKIVLKTVHHVLKSTLRDWAVGDVTDSNVKGMVKSNMPELILSAGESCVLLTISDTGIGIESKNLERIFDPFYTTVTQGGTGLGLAMLKRTVNAHKGIIRVVSEFGKGTVFNIYLPLNK